MSLEERSTLIRLKLLPRLFRNADVEKLAPHADAFLARALRKGFIHRLMRGHYVNSLLHGFPRVEVVGCFLRPPAYVSGEWALNYHGISMQAPVVCSVVTLSSAVGTRRNVLYQGITIEFSKIAPTIFSGFTLVEDFAIATPEKAVLDTLHLRKALPAADELDWDAVDRNAMRTMAKSFPLSVTRRLEVVLGRE